MERKRATSLTRRLQLVQTGAGPSTYDHVDHAALSVLNEFLCTMEGPYWKQIRGPGLSYGYGIKVVIEEGFITFNLTKSVNLPRAYQAAKQVVQDFVSGKAKFEPAFVQSARSSTLFSVISKEETMKKASIASFQAFLRGRIDNKVVLVNIAKCTEADIERALKTWVAPLFDEAKTNVAIAVSASKLVETQALFKDQGRQLVALPEALETHYTL